MHDHIGNVAALIDLKTGTAVEYYRYSAFGEELLFDGNSHPIDHSDNPWRFASKRLDDETGFIYFGRRYYEPVTGRWITPDPISHADGPNLYAYVRNRPLTTIDHYGFFGEGENPFGTIGNYFCTAITYIGNCIDAFATHFVPVPIVRELIQATGRFLSGQGFTTSHAMLRGTNSYGHLGRPEPITKDGRWCLIIIIGGICTSQEDMRLRAEKFSDSLGGFNVHYYASASDGVLLGLCKAGIHCFGIMLLADQNFGDIAYHLSEEVDADGLIFIKVHSQGGMVLDNFRQYSTLDDQKGSKIAKKMDVISYGSGRILKRSDYRNATNYISERDMVPLIASPKDCCQVLVCPRGDTFFLKSKSLPFLDHGFDNNTYQEVDRRVNIGIKDHMRSSL